MDKDGYLVVPAVFSTDELVRLRMDIESHLANRWIECDCGKVQSHGAVTCPSIAWLFSHPRIVAAVRGAMGCDDIIFTGDCNLHHNKLGNWHKDIGGIHGGYFKEDVFSTDHCRVFKVGVYLQDHDRDGAGFRVRRGSHRSMSMNVGEIEYVPTRAGDALVFDVRLTHAGMLPDPVERVIWRISRGLSRSSSELPWGRYATELWWRVAGKQDRLSVFFTYGAQNAYTEEFARNIRRALESSQVPGAEQRLDPALVETLRRSGVGIASET